VRFLLETVQGVEEIEVRPVTGSVTIYYDPEITSSEALLNVLEQDGYVSKMANPAMQSASGSDRQTEQIGDAVGKALFGFAVEKIVERSAMALIAAVI